MFCGCVLIVVGVELVFVVGIFVLKYGFEFVGKIELLFG